MFKSLFVFILLACISVTAYGVVGGGDIKFTVKDSVGDVVFSHDTHVVDAEMNCTECHTKYYLNSKFSKKPSCRREMVKNKSCGACHDGRKSELDLKKTCTECHEKK